tara:strand:- start:70 stop:582 length:513 start_codon:yes stop_codon:yes gene_type:complete
MAFKMTSPFHVEKSPRFQVIPDIKPKKTESADEESRRDFTSNLKKKKPTPTPKTKTPTPRKKVERNEVKGAKINSYVTSSEKDIKDSTPKISTKKPTVKPKDNSRKAIRQRKKADKAAGVSKSQMRANKAKSKSEAFMAKAKASKDPSMRSQLKRKSDRLAKRAARKGNS